MEARGGDLHSNATADRRSINLSTTLLKHHKEHPDEILAILAHEMGHLKLHHLFKMILLNVLYMVIFASAMIPVIGRDAFLASFNIYHESSFMTFLLYGLLYQHTLDIPIRVGLLWHSRQAEHEADEFAVKKGFENSIKNSLVRAFMTN